MRTLSMIVTAGVVIATLPGCASTPPPVGELAAAKATVAQVETMGARYAPQQLRAAQLKLQRAETAMANENYDLARRLAEQAEVDARLAYTMAESEQASQALAEVQQSMRTLKQELQRRAK